MEILVTDNFVEFVADLFLSWFICRHHIADTVNQLKYCCEENSEVEVSSHLPTDHTCDRGKLTLVIQRCWNLFEQAGQIQWFEK